MNSLSAGGSVAGSAPVQTGSEWSPLARQIVELLRQRPASGSALARRLGARRAAVLAACRQLHAEGRLERTGNKWRVAPAVRCAGQNTAGERCARQAALGETFCLHHAPDPVECCPEDLGANTPEPSLTAAVDALSAEELEVFLGILEQYALFKNRDEQSLTPDEGAEYIATLSMLHWLSRVALVRQGHPICDCETCDGIEMAFEANDRDERKAARRSLPSTIAAEPRDSTQAPASNALALLPQEPAPAKTLPSANDIIWED